LYRTSNYITFSQKPRINDDDDTVIALNLSYPKLFRTCALNPFLTSTNFAGALLTLKTGNAITNSGATQIFVIDSTPVFDTMVTTNPLTVSLADSHQVSSTHV
jgi:hypothetical protein